MGFQRSQVTWLSGNNDALVSSAKQRAKHCLGSTLSIFHVDDGHLLHTGTLGQ